MFKELLEASNHAFGVTRDIENTKRDIEAHDKELDELRGDVSNLEVKVERLAFEIERIKDRLDSDEKRAHAERTALVLQLENALLKFERRLPPASNERNTE